MAESSGNFFDKTINLKSLASDIHETYILADEYNLDNNIDETAINQICIETKREADLLELKSLLNILFYPDHYDKNNFGIFEKRIEELFDKYSIDISFLAYKADYIGIYKKQYTIGITMIEHLMSSDPQVNEVINNNVQKKIFSNDLSYDKMDNFDKGYFLMYKKIILKILDEGINDAKSQDQLSLNYMRKQLILDIYNKIDADIDKIVIY